MYDFDFYSIVEFLMYPESSGWLLWTKILFLIVNLAMVAFIIFSLTTTSWLDKLILHDVQEFLTYKHYGLSKTRKKWKEIESHFKGRTEPEMKLAIVEAASLLDNVLRIMSYKGKDLGERLEGLNVDILDNLDEVKKYHKIYFNIIHDPTYRLDFEEAKQAIRSYRAALVNLGAL